MQSEKNKFTVQILSLIFCSSFIFGCSNNDSDLGPLKETVKGDTRSDVPANSGNWFTKDPGIDGFEGTSSERAISELNLTHPKQIVVAVLDSGVDIQHEDLQGKIWQNAGEMGIDLNGTDKATNKIDDDQNGYVDDVHGWNFLGSADGRNVEIDTLEITREAARFDKLKENGVHLSDGELSYYEKVKTDFERQYTQALSQIDSLKSNHIKATAAASLLKETLNLTDLSKSNLEAIVSDVPEVLKAKDDLLQIIESYKTVPRFFRIYNTAKNNIDYYLNKSYNSRSLVGDDPDDFSQTKYGNNDVTGPESSHGTHVAGIIAATRNNGIGIDGVAENVKIMVLRVVPNGDERDKDIVLAVRYAVDHGAHIINMSFGKSHSPQKTQVDRAFLYAASKNVLIVHAAGNSATDNDQVVNYPNRTVTGALIRNDNEANSEISTWLEIGASSKNRGLNLIAGFSDYGKKDVDFFSPGVDLNSTTPKNTYSVFSGTSMAAPVTSGVAALLLSNSSQATAVTAKNLILQRVRLYDSLSVQLPGTGADTKPVPFADLSATGGVVDAFHLFKTTL